MASLIGIDNAIGWAHWQLGGGWKKSLSATSFYVVMEIVALVFALRWNPQSSANILAGSRSLLLYLQAGVLVLFAGSRVAAAIRGDMTNRMIESHRLMPIPPAVAVSGYIWGPAA